MERGTLIAVVGACVVLVVVALVDLARHEVRHIPRWAWAIFIVVSFPLGMLSWFVVGRGPLTRSADGPAGHANRGVEAGVSTTAPSVRTTALSAVTVTATAFEDRPLAVRTRGLTKVYGSAAVLDEVDLRVPVGATYGLIGPNGSGKTTMLSILAGLRRPTSGEIEIEAQRLRMGLLVDTPLFEPWLTAREVVDLARHLTAPDLPRDRVDEVLVEVGLGDATDRACGGFSRGMLQRLGLAGCLVGDPDILVLDEPSSALDPSGRREVLELIGRLAHTKTVLLSTHILSDVQQVCDVVGVLDGGRLRFQGPIAELLARTSTSYQLTVRGPAAGLVEALRSCVWATEVVEHAPGRISMSVRDATAAEVEVPAVLAAQGAALVSFSPATDLERAFLELTS